MVKQLFSTTDIRKFGFQYEPDESKCDLTRLHGAISDLNDKSQIAGRIWCKYVNSVFIKNGILYVKGHTTIDLI